MKILCLHGNNMSGAMQAIQTNNFRRLLGGDEHEYVFLDGEVESECVIGLEDISTGPYYRWSIGITAPEVKRVLEYIESVIEDEGPFDGVLGFSQGSALATTMLLQHEINHPNDPPPFSFAILFSNFLVVSPDAKFAQKEYDFAQKHNSNTVLRALKGLKLMEADEKEGDEDTLRREMIEKIEKLSGKKISSTAPKSRIELLRGSKRAALVYEIFDALATSARVGALYHKKVADLLPDNIDGGLDTMPRIFHPLLLSERVKVPTAYIIGRSDPFLKQDAIARRLFDKDNTRFVEHSGGHDVPRLDRDVKAAVAAAQWAIQRAQVSAVRGRPSGR